MRFSKTAILATGLFLSLVANLLLGGMVMGRQYAGRGIGDQQTLKPIYKVMKELTPEQRQQVKGVTEPAQAALKEKYKEIKQLREQIRDLMLADKVERRPLRQAYAEYRRATGEVQETVHDVMVKVAAILPPAQREHMIEEGRPEPRERAKEDKPEARDAKDVRERPQKSDRREAPPQDASDE